MVSMGQNVTWSVKGIKIAGSVKGTTSAASDKHKCSQECHGNKGGARRTDVLLRGRTIAGGTKVLHGRQIVAGKTNVWQ